MSATRLHPLLSGLLPEVLADGALAGRQVALAGPLDGARAVLAERLEEAGARLVAPEEAELAIDRGGELAGRTGARLRGLVEPVGMLPVSPRGVPVVVSAASAVTRLAWGGPAVGDAVVRELLRRTNLSLAGRVTAVLGHGEAGAAVARAVRALGGRTVVVEDDPALALAAALAGHAIAPLATALAGADVAVVCERAVTAAELAPLPDGALVACAVPGALELADVRRASGAPRTAGEPGGAVAAPGAVDEPGAVAAPAAGEQPRPGIVRVGRLNVVAGGAALVSPAGDGLPPEAADALLTAQGLALHLLARERLAPGLHPLPPALDERIARAWLAARSRARGAGAGAGRGGAVAAASEGGGAAAASAGAARIEWAREWMPALAAVARELRDGGALDGMRVAISLTLDPTTAALALALQRAGARVAVHAPPEETDDAVAAALADAGIAVFARSDGDRAALADALLDSRPQLLLDDGAHLIGRLHRERRDALPALRGAAEETTSGVRRLHAMAAAGELAIPCLAVDDALTKRIADNGHATGQSCVMAILDTTGMTLAGRVVAVAGYGPVGRGVARHAAALGARVTVSEVDPHRALEALLDGHAVQPLADACRAADLLISATGVAHTVTRAHLRALPDGAVVAVAGGVEEEVETAAGAPPPRVTVLAGGACVNVTLAEGNPIEAMDCSLALQALAADRLARHAATLAPGVHTLPPELDARVARLRLAAAGAAIDAPTAAQRAALESW